MKYIRTKDGKIGKVISVRDYNGPIPTFYHVQFANDKEIYSDYELNIIAKADTIEELCDEFVLFYDSEETKPDLTYRGGFNDLYFQNELKHSAKCYGAIWTNKGLIYVAKMNDKGELELL